MKKYMFIVFGSLFCLTVPSFAEDTQSRIVSVKVFQNQALIEREATVRLKKGENAVTLSGFPRELYDWSVKSALPKDFDAKIMSLQVEQKMLLERFQKKVGVIEAKLKELRNKDRVYIDELAELKSQEKFIDSVLGFSVDTAQKELMTRIPQVKVWDDTLSYCSAKKKSIIERRRQVESLREDLGREIQKYEFELSQIAGTNYYNSYQNIERAQMSKRSALEAQQYSDANADYGLKLSYLNNPAAGTDIEKNVTLSVYSGRDADARITVSYMIPRTDWDMVYDFRASRESGKLGISVYGDVYQKTGEDWNGITLQLSTGSPVNRPGTPVFNPWYLTAYVPAKEAPSRGYAKSAAPAAQAMDRDEEVSLKRERKESFSPPETAVAEKGGYIELTLPLAQTIVSSDRRQKKFIKEYALTSGKGLRYSYEVFTWHSNNAFLTAEVVNMTDIPFLPGVAQVFIENEYYGLINIPYMVPGKKESIPLGAETRVKAEKILVKKFEDTKGVFGGKTRIVYNYQINIENNMKETIDLTVQDIIPVSQNEKIEIEISNQSVQPLPSEGADDSKFKQGLRKYRVSLTPGQKKTVSYDLSVTYDKEMIIRGLR
jgi:uncharacterized protein (TIGR02231 family)